MEAKNMPKIIPIRDLKNTCKISEDCHASDDPIFITKNGYGDMVIMSIEAYEKAIFMNELYDKLAKAEKSKAEGRVSPASEVMERLEKKYGL